MNKYYILFFLINILISQNSGVITYNYKSNLEIDEEKLNNNEAFRLLKSVDNDSENFTYSLNFSDGITEFKVNEMPSDEMSILTQMRLKGISNLYADYVKDTLYFKNSLGINSYHISKISDIKWNLTDESKLISDKLCFKATTEFVMKRVTGEKKILITAWYCPEIPISYGPYNFGGLPGLILELIHGKFSFVVSKIELGKKVDVNLPNFKRIMSFDEYIQEFKKKNPYTDMH